MPRRVLVLHGPTLTLEAVLGQTLSSLDASLIEKGRALGLEVECAQANGEAGLLDALLGRPRPEGLIVNPASLAPVAFALADAVEALGLPCIEVQLAHESKGRGRSALRRVVEKQFHGHGVAGYDKALVALSKHPGPGAAASTPTGPVHPAPTSDEHDEVAHRADDEAVDQDTPAHDPGETSDTTDLAAGARAAPSGKTIGRKKAPQPAGSAAMPGKTIGRKPAVPPHPGPSVASTPGVISRAMVREQLSARLGKTISGDAFAQWARAQWLAVQKGAPVEPGQKEALEELLLLLSTSAKASDHVILSYAARLAT